MFNNVQKCSATLQHAKESSGRVMDVIETCNIYFRIFRNFYLFVIQKWVRMSLNVPDGFAILTGLYLLFRRLRLFKFGRVNKKFLFVIKHEL